MVGSIHLQLAPSASSYDPHGPHSASKRTYLNVDDGIPAEEPDTWFGRTDDPGGRGEGCGDVVISSFFLFRFLFIPSIPHVPWSAFCFWTFGWLVFPFAMKVR